MNGTLTAKAREGAVRTTEDCAQPALNFVHSLLANATSPLALETVLVDFKPIRSSKIGELAANFDIVLGRTFDETAESRVRGGIGPSERDGGRGGARP